MLGGERAILSSQYQVVETNQMSAITNELLQIAQHFESISTQGETPEIQEALERLYNAAEQVGKSWCGSGLGYHSRVYYKNLKPVPPGARFSQEWGLMPTAFVRDTVGEWVEYDFETVVNAIHNMAGNPDLSAAEAFVKTVRVEVENMRPELVSLLSTELQTHNDSFLSNLREKVENYTFYSYQDYVTHLVPSGQFISRDSAAYGEGFRSSPHHNVLARVVMIRHYFEICKEFAKIPKQAASHISRLEQRQNEQQEPGIANTELDRELRKAQIVGIKRQLINQIRNLNKLLEEASTYGSRTSAPLKLQNDIEEIEAIIVDLGDKLSTLEENL